MCFVPAPNSRSRRSLCQDSLPGGAAPQQLGHHVGLLRRGRAGREQREAGRALLLRQQGRGQERGHEQWLVFFHYCQTVTEVLLNIPSSSEAVLLCSSVALYHCNRNDLGDLQKPFSDFFIFSMTFTNKSFII